MFQILVVEDDSGLEPYGLHVFEPTAATRRPAA